MDIIAKISEELGVKDWQVKAAVELIDAGCTIPFIARYRKEKTGSLNDEELRNLGERLTYLRNLEEKKAQVISAIESQEKLTPELKKQIEEAQTLVSVEDLYRPYRPKRRTRAMIAKENGLEPLAQLIASQMLTQPLEETAKAYINENVKDTKAALTGASDILAEQVSDEANYRTAIRRMTVKEGVLKTTAKKPEEKSVYEMYYDYSEPVKRIVGHRILAINRGEKEKILTVTLEAPEAEILSWLEKRIIKKQEPETTEFLKTMIADSYRRLIAPAIEREIRSDLTETAEDGAIKVFGKNLTQLLMQPPIAGVTVLGWDPAFRTGCKLAVVDPTGKVLDTTVVYPTAPTTPAKIAAAKETVKKMIKKYHVELISLGNGTASRESEAVIAEMLHEIPEKVSYMITNEAGASVYSASKLATEEYPDLDVGERSSASIARRLQDPLAELVKIDPKSIGVGQYQHDMNQKKLGEALNAVVEDCVNRVGVDLNTASPSLLEYVSGISSTVASNIVKYREANGRFRSRKELLKVPKLGPKAFQQCAGFLRISGGVEPLDATAVHPESYEAARTILATLGYSEADLAKGGVRDLASNPKLSAVGAGSEKGAGKGKKENSRNAAENLGIGEYTLKDILEELEKPGRDPRSEAAAPILRSDVMEVKDLKPGMELKGTVRNIVDFGAFVDIGVHQDGLVHISQLADRFVKHPLDVVKVGDIVDVRVLDVDVKREKISLTMRKDKK